MDFQRRDVDFSTLWNVATWISNVATLIFQPSGTSRRGFPTSRRWLVTLSRTSRRFPERRDVSPNVATFPRTSRRWHNPSLQCRDVAPNVATLPCFKANNSPFCSSLCTHHFLSPSNHTPPVPCRSYLSRRSRLVHSPLTLPSLSPSHTGSLSPLHLHHTALGSSTSVAI